MSINTREELVYALHEASQVEHALLVQYLYASLSCKKSGSEGLDASQQQLLRSWQSTIYAIAREEMGHLGIVCNLLASVGANAKFSRLAMPIKSGYYPFAFDLMPFGDEALHKFLVFELPRNYPKPPPPNADLSSKDALRFSTLAMQGTAPDPLEYEFVGELYAKIADGFREIPEDDLFVGPKSAQSENDWSDNSLDMRVVTNRQEALAAIENIIIDGEGTPGDTARSHFHRFNAIRKEFFDSGRFDATRKVPLNPATRVARDVDGKVSLIKNPTSLKMAELFNSAYELMLFMLLQYFSSAPEPNNIIEVQRRRTLQQASQRIMSTLIRPLSEVLTEQPLDDPLAPERAAPCFEIYTNIDFSPYPVGQWTNLLERFQVLINGCAEFKGQFPRIVEMGETLSIMRSDIAEALKGGP